MRGFPVSFAGTQLIATPWAAPGSPREQWPAEGRNDRAEVRQSPAPLSGEREHVSCRARVRPRYRFLRFLRPRRRSLPRVERADGVAPRPDERAPPSRAPAASLPDWRRSAPGPPGPLPRAPARYAGVRTRRPRGDAPWPTAGRRGPGPLGAGPDAARACSRERVAKRPAPPAGDAPLRGTFAPRRPAPDIRLAPTPSKKRCFRPAGRAGGRARRAPSAHGRSWQSRQ